LIYPPSLRAACRPAGSDPSAEGVQRDLLPLIEGSVIQTKHGPVATDHVLFIASGAFTSAKPSDMMAELQVVRVSIITTTTWISCLLLLLGWRQLVVAVASTEYLEHLLVIHSTRLRMVFKAYGLLQ